MGNEKTTNPLPGIDIAVVQPEVEVTTPKRYNIILLNDDYTPMDFVVEVLEQFFGMSNAKAVEVMWTIHTQGQAVGGCYPLDIAETKVLQVSEFAKLNQHPLLCLMEAE